MVDRFDAVDRERVASSDASGRGDRDGLIAVVHVQNTASAGGGRLRNVTHLSAVGGDGAAGRVSSAAVRIVELVGLEACDFTDIRTLVSISRLVAGERTGRHRQVASHAVVIAARQSEVTITGHHALLVHDAVAQSNVIIGASSGCDRNHEGALSSGQVHNREVDVRSQLLLGRVTEATFLQSIAQFQSVHLPSRALVETERRGNRQLSHVRDIASNRGANGAVERLGDVGLRTPDGVTSAFHRHAVGVVDGDVLAEDQRVVEAFEDVLKSNNFFLGKAVSHLKLLRN